MYLNQKMFKLVFLVMVFSSCVPTGFDEEKQSFVYEDNERAPSSYSDAVSATQKVRTGDRIYIANVFKNVFGPNFNSSNVVKNNIIVNQGIFGGGCDLYESSTKGADSTSFEYDWNVCFDSDRNTDQIMESSTLKEGWLVRTCETIINNNSTSVNYALALADIKSDTQVSYEAVNRLYNLFFINDDLPVEAYNVLASYKDEFSSNEFYKNSLLTFCISPNWLIL